MKSFKNQLIYLEGKGIVKTNLNFSNVIADIGSDRVYDVIELEEDSIVLPGFIDEHVHGGGSSDTMDATIDALDTISNTLAKEGVTSYLATTMTQSQEKITKALANVKNYIELKKENGSRVLGVHLEGPFLSSKYKGAQKDDYIVNPSVEIFKKYEEASNDNIKLVTLAVEEPGAIELIKYLNSKRIVASVGHSNAKCSDIEESIKYGLKSVTHTFNAQSPLHHREIGVVGSTLLADDLNAELIADTIHVSVPAMKILYKSKPLDKITLITDAIRAKGLGDTESELGGQKVFVKDNEARLIDGTLAGSVLQMNIAVKNMVNKVGVEFTKAIDMATINPAKNLFMDDKIGSIRIGKNADFTVLNRDFEVLLTIRDGKIIYKR